MDIYIVKLDHHHTVLFDVLGICFSSMLCFIGLHAELVVYIYFR